MKFKRVDQVVKWRLCLGCGACAHRCPENNIRLVDVVDQGIRPCIDLTKCKSCGECVKVCPGIEMSRQSFNGRSIPELLDCWGPVMEIWEGYAADPEIRFEGSSGGAATALALFCLEREKFAGVLHTGTKPEAPLRNVPVFSRNRDELLRFTGSRYSPAAPCERLDWIENSSSPCVFIGKPCDVAALRKSQAVNQGLNSKVGLAISIFCAGTPSSKGTYNLLSALDVIPEQVEEIRYRGRGWPGMTTVKVKGRIRQMSYKESWDGILSKYGQFRCRLCPDSTGEFADISCGDPWYREIKPGELGRSLVLVRTEQGRKIVQDAMEAGYLMLKKVSPAVLPASQKALLNKRQHLFGRLLAMQIMQVPAPCFRGFSLRENWLKLPAIKKLCSVGGSLKRIITRGWFMAQKPRQLKRETDSRATAKMHKSPSGENRWKV